MICPKCGNQVNGNAKFCSVCGTDLSAYAQVNVSNQQQFNPTNLTNKSIELPSAKRSLFSFDTIVGLVPMLMYLLALIIPISLSSKSAGELAEEMGGKSTAIPLFSVIGLVGLVFVVLATLLTLRANKTKKFALNRILYVVVAFIAGIFAFLAPAKAFDTIGRSIFGDDPPGELVARLDTNIDTSLSIAAIAMLICLVYLVLSIIMRKVSKNRVQR